MTIFRDKFTQWLERMGGPYQTEVYQPGAFLGAPPIGWRLTVGRTRFVYRVPPERPDTLYIVLIERDGGRSALHSPFVDMVRLLRVIKGSGAGIQWIRGHVEPTSNRPDDALGRERILAFYRRYLTAVSTGVENGVEWFGGNLEAFSWEKEKQKIRTRSGEVRGAARPEGNCALT